MNVEFLKSYNGIPATANVKPFKADNFYGVIHKRRAYKGNAPRKWISYSNCCSAMSGTKI